MTDRDYPDDSKTAGHDPRFVRITRDMYLGEPKSTLCHLCKRRSSDAVGYSTPKRRQLSICAGCILRLNEQLKLPL